MPQDKTRPLSEKERRFVEAYMGACAGNATAAAKAAGYKGTDAVIGTTAARVLKKAGVQAAIAERAASDPQVSKRKDRQRWWTAVMLDSTVPLKERLRASELLGKSHADFVERRHLSGPNGGPIPVEATTRVTFYYPSNGRELTPKAPGQSSGPVPANPAVAVPPGNEEVPGGKTE